MPFRFNVRRSLGAGPIPGGGAALPVFDPAQKAPQVVINADGSATRSGSGNAGVRALPGKSSGKWYFEMLCVNRGSGGGFAVGVTNANYNVSSDGGPPGRNGATGISLCFTAIEYPTGNSKSATAANPGDTVGLTVDLTNPNLLRFQFYLNGAVNASETLIDTPLGTVFPTFTGFDAVDQAKFTAKYPPPTGFTAWS